MQRIALSTAALAALTFTSVGAMAQTKPSPPPVPGAFGEVRDANPINPQPAPGQPVATGTCAPGPNASGSQTTNPCTYDSTTQQGMIPSTTGSTTVSPPPVPNASGSQTTNPATYRNTAPQ